MAAEVAQQSLVLFVCLFLFIDYLCVIILPISYHLACILEDSGLVFEIARFPPTFLNELSNFTLHNRFSQPWVVSEIVRTLSFFHT